MWKKISCLLAVILVACGFFSVNVEAGGNEITNEPYVTKVIGLEGGLVSSSMAYEGINVLNVGFNDPEDIFIDDSDNVYIADKGNKVIYKYYPSTDKLDVIGEGFLNQPTGVCVADNGDIYVADSGAKMVYVFDSQYEYKNSISKPNPDTDPLFGTDSIYTPVKVAVDKAYNVFIVSQGNADGIIQINKDGEFVSYFGRNTTTLSFDLMFRRLFATEEEKESKYSLSPKPTTNITIDNKNIVYTLVENDQSNALKKYNVNGSNLLGSDLMFSDGYKDIAVDNDGYIYTVSDEREGVITVRDSNGTVLFTFGNTVTGSMSMGHFDEAIGIDVDSSGNLWVLDGAGKNLQVFTRTKFATTVMNAMNLYNLGEYELAEEAYREIIAQNASFVQAYIGLGNIAQRNQEFETALEYFRIANHKSGYSDAFWEIRDNWLGNNLIWIAIVVVVLVLLKVLKVKQFILKKTGWDFTPTKEKIKNNSYYKEFAYIPRMLTKPNDTLYDVKFLQKIRFSTALIFFALFVFINILCDTVITGYIFKTQLESQVNIGFELLKWGLIIILIIIGNFLVSSLQKGEGFFRDIFIGVMLAFAPILIGKLPIAILSNVLTYNESYLIDLANMVLWAWSIFNVILVFKNVHNYKLGELIVNIVLTLVAVIILVFLFLMVYILFMQFYDFVAGLIEEAIIR